MLLLSTIHHLPVVVVLTNGMHTQFLWACAPVCPSLAMPLPLVLLPDPDPNSPSTDCFQYCVGGKDQCALAWLCHSSLVLLPDPNSPARIASSIACWGRGGDRVWGIGSGDLSSGNADLWNVDSFHLHDIISIVKFYIKCTYCWFVCGSIVIVG